MLRNIEGLHKEKLQQNNMYVGELVNRNNSSVSSVSFHLIN